MAQGDPVMPETAPPTESRPQHALPPARPSDLVARLGLDGVLLAWGNLVFRYRDYLAPVVILFVVSLTRPLPAGGDAHRDVFLDVLGFTIAACGQAVRVLVIGLAYIQRGGKNKQIAADHLVVDGLFAHCRHPLYLGNALMISGLLIIWNSPWAYLLAGGVVALSLFSMAYAEEAFLLRQFGAEYAAYCTRVNRFVPDPRGLGQTLGRFEFDWKRVVRKDYTTTLSWTTTALLLIVLEHAAWDGAQGARGIAGPILSIWLCIVALWAVARWMKKSGRLISPD
jgi:protein-S-isoprenylcysteine O-methyltransferase Ste14